MNDDFSNRSLVINKIRNDISITSLSIEQEISRHKQAMRVLNNKKNNLKNSELILSGSFGFIKCFSGSLRLTSGMNILDIVKDIKHSSCFVSLERLKGDVGFDTWFIDQDGKITLIETGIDFIDSHHI